VKIVIAVLLLLPSIAVAQSRPKPSVTCPTGAACTTFNQMRLGHDEDIKYADWACFYTESFTTRDKDFWFFAGPNPASMTLGPMTPHQPETQAPTTDEFFLLEDGKKDVMKNGLHPGIFEKAVTRGLPDDSWHGFGPRSGGLAEAYNPAWADEKSIIVRTFDDLASDFRFAIFWYTTPKQECLVRRLLENGSANCDSLPTQYSILQNYDIVTVHKSTGRFVETQRNGADTDTFTGQCFRLNK
jgi:hypothetical protein